METLQFEKTVKLYSALLLNLSSEPEANTTIPWMVGPVSRCHVAVLPVTPMDFRFALPMWGCSFGPVER